MDVNTHDSVGDVFAKAGADVAWANKAYDKGTPDKRIDYEARRDGRIIVSHDRRFLQMIQQRRFQFDVSASTGYGRVLLCGNESRQADRIREVLPLLDLIREWAIATGRRFIVSVGDNWIRFDDKPIARIIRDDSPAL